MIKGTNMRNFIGVAVLMFFIGCAHTEDLIEKPFVDPQYGMTKKEMTDLIGKPDSIQIYKKTDQTRVEFYIYIKRYPASQEKIPVCLINNKVVGWGKTFYEDHISVDDIRIK